MIDKQLADFLLARGYFHQFKENIENFGRPTTKEIRQINSAFQWSATPEGHSFWSQLHQEYWGIQR